MEWLYLENKKALFLFQAMLRYVYLEPVNVLYFWDSTLQKMALYNQNKGHLGSGILYFFCMLKSERMMHVHLITT